MFHQPTPSKAQIPSRKKRHQHHESKTWTRLAANEICLRCYPIRKPFLETAFGKVPPEIREKIFADILKVGSLSPLKDGISVPMTKVKHDLSGLGSKPKLSIGPEKSSSCLALLQTCRQIYHESSLLFYAINTVYLSSPEDMLMFLRHLGPVRCGELRSLHLENLIIQAPVFSQRDLDQFYSQRTYPEDVIARFKTLRTEKTHPDAKKAVQLLNKRGNIRKIYLTMRPSETLEYINFFTKVPGCEYSEIEFASPTRWSVRVSSTSGRIRPWFLTFLEGEIKKSVHEKPYYAYWGGLEKYRVEVDILPALPKGRSASMEYSCSGDGEIEDGSGVDTAMKDLNLS